MQIEFDKKQYEILLKLVYLGNWMANAHRTEDFKEGLLVYAALLAVTFAAHFFWFTKFGLYEDDFVFVAVPANLDFSQILRLLKEIFAGNPEGRVIGFMLPHVFSYVLYNISGIPAMYLLV